jgi:hypothetical protein
MVDGSAANSDAILAKEKVVHVATMEEAKIKHNCPLFWGQRLEDEIENEKRRDLKGKCSASEEGHGTNMLHRRSRA